MTSDIANPASEALAILCTVAAAEGQSTRFGRGRAKVEEAEAEIARLRSEPHDNRELVAAFMMRNGFTTGHGDTTAALLAELEAEIKERAEAAESALSTARSEGERVGIARVVAQAFEIVDAHGLPLLAEKIRALSASPEPHIGLGWDERKGALMAIRRTLRNRYIPDKDKLALIERSVASALLPPPVRTGEVGNE